jgi:hypothetical protein
MANNAAIRAWVANALLWIGRQVSFMPMPYADQDASVGFTDMSVALQSAQISVTNP